MEAPTEAPTEDITATGDLILLVGRPPKVKLRVSSSTLTSCSKVFTALLGPNFSEGQTAGSAQSPKKIELPEDGDVAMSDMCNLLSSKVVGDLLKPVSPRRVLNLAIAADKYACVESFRLQSQGILLNTIEAFAYSSLVNAASTLTA